MSCLREANWWFHCVSALFRHSREQGGGMTVLVLREPRPDAPYWPGRRRLAAVDAVIWPMAVPAAVHQVPELSGLFGAAAVIAGLWAFFRLCCAIFNNQRYWFATWWIVRLVGLLLLVQLVAKLVMLVS